MKNNSNILLLKYNFNERLKLTRKQKFQLGSSGSLFLSRSFTIKVEQFHGSYVHEVNEYFTFKTCFFYCGRRWLMLDRRISCVNCSSVLNRDANAAQLSISASIWWQAVSLSLVNLPLLLLRVKEMLGSPWWGLDPFVSALCRSAVIPVELTGRRTGVCFFKSLQSAIWCVNTKRQY